MSRPRLMLMISAAGLGGAELTFRHLVQYIDVDRHDVCAVTPEWPDLAALAHTRGIEHVALPLAGRPRVQTLRDLGRLMQGWRPDLVHSQLLNGDVYAALASLRARPRRLVSTVQGLNYRWDLERFPRRQRYWGFARVYRSIYAPFDAMVACSHALREALCTGPGVRVSAAKIGVIHNAVDLARFATPSGGGLAPPSAGVTAPARVRRRLITVGNLAPVKGHELLLRALPGLADLDVECLIVGDGPLRGRLEALARELGLTNRVAFLGARGDVRALLQTADLFVFPSLWEGFGIAVVEAMALGVPVVAVRRGGVPEIVEDGVTGVLVPPNDPGALVGAMRRGLTDEALRAAIVPKARCRAQEFDAPDMVAKYESWYATVLGTSTAPGAVRAPAVPAPSVE